MSVAYGVTGQGPIDVVMIPGFTSHAELAFENPFIAQVFERIAKFARVIWFDKRGTGLSDPVDSVPSLEVRMDDVRAVMDAAGSGRAALFAFSEGAAMAILFAATYPERTHSLALIGGMARSTWAPDYPWATDKESLLESARMLTSSREDAFAEIFGPSCTDESILDWHARYDRAGASPGMIAKVYLAFLDIDVRSVLPSVHVPTIVMHKRGDRVVNRRAGMYLAEHIPGARYIELSGNDHALWARDNGEMLDHLEEFITGVRPLHEPDRVLATVLFTDIVNSTTLATKLGDTEWRALLERHNTITRKAIAAHRGKEIKATGDGFLSTFDGPARAIRCASEIVLETGNLDIEIRAGLHSGEIELLDDDIAGIAVNIASRVADQAGPGEILVSQTVRDLVVGSDIKFAQRGTHLLKGVNDEWRLYCLVE
ncbi:MAG: adenylate/guanylate cyclase domain-containing protein [Actinomycetota bacterium]